MKKAVVIAVLLFGFSCKKQEVPSIVKGCREIYDQATTLQKMVGRWKYVAVGCAYCTKPGVQSITENVEILITKERKITTFVDGVAVKTSDFFLENSYNEQFFKMETVPFNENTYTYGIIELCQNELAFKNSYVDGGDYYFRKIE